MDTFKNRLKVAAFFIDKVNNYCWESIALYNNYSDCVFYFSSCIRSICRYTNSSPTKQLTSALEQLWTLLCQAGRIVPKLKSMSLSNLNQSKWIPLKYVSFNVLFFPDSLIGPMQCFRPSLGPFLGKRQMSVLFTERCSYVQWNLMRSMGSGSLLSSNRGRLYSKPNCCICSQPQGMTVERCTG